MRRSYFWSHPHYLRNVLLSYGAGTMFYGAGMLSYGTRYLHFACIYTVFKGT